MSTISRRPTTVYAKSEGERFNADTTLVVVKCFTCGVTYAIPASFDSSARKYHGDKNGWWICCPFGHTWGYTGQTDVEAARLQRDAARDDLAAERARHDQTKGSLRAQKGVTTKIRKRIAKGVCPCCNRTFADLARHMECKHPDYAEPKP